MLSRRHSKAAPLRPRLFIDWTHSSSCSSVAFFQRASSAGGITVMVCVLVSSNTLRPGTSLPAWVAPKNADSSRPEFLSMTAFRSGGSESYLALFMGMTNTVVYKAG